jgi:hypothetical protein
MGFIIYIAKADALRVSKLNDQLSHLCECILERNDCAVYLPLAGKVIDVLEIFAKNSIEYQLKDEVTYVSYSVLVSSGHKGSQNHSA